MRRVPAMVLVAIALVSAIAPAATPEHPDDNRAEAGGFMWGLGLAVGGVFGDRDQWTYWGGGFRFIHDLAPFRLDGHLDLIGTPGDSSDNPGNHLVSLGVGAAWVPLDGALSPYVGLGAALLLGYWPGHGGADGLGLYGAVGGEFFRGARVRLMVEARVVVALYELPRIEPAVPQAWVVLLW